MSQSKILIVDDEKNVRRSLAVTLEDAGFSVQVAEDAIRAFERVRSDSFDLLILDIKMGEISGIQLFQKLRIEGFLVPVLFMSGNASLTEAVETIKLGGADFLEKPFEPEQLLIAVNRALRIGELEKKLRELGAGESSRSHIRREMVGESAQIVQLWSAIEKVAPTRSKVLIQGETGTGKELIAKAIHVLSSVASGPFIRVNCAAIPENLIESELFGHERGAFTGATNMKRGLFELAHRGTIFLDEIAEMGASAQAKVLRVLQTQEFTRVGGSAMIKVDVRVIAATHRDLVAEVAQGRFREDLLFRINVVPMRSTPLRERKEDIPLIVDRFIRDCCAENGLTPKEISPEALDILMNYGWPGNVRELKNMVERLIVFSGERIEFSDIPDEIRSSEESAIPPTHLGTMTLDSFKRKAERDYIISILKKSNGNISQAARLLDLERTYLHRKIHEHAIEKKEYF